MKFLINLNYLFNTCGPKLFKHIISTVSPIRRSLNQFRTDTKSDRALALFSQSDRRPNDDGPSLEHPKEDRDKKMYRVRRRGRNREELPIPIRVRRKFLRSTSKIQWRVQILRMFYNHPFYTTPFTSPLY